MQTYTSAHSSSKLLIHSKIQFLNINLFLCKFLLIILFIIIIVLKNKDDHSKSAFFDHIQRGSYLTRPIKEEFYIYFSCLFVRILSSERPAGPNRLNYFGNPVPSDNYWPVLSKIISTLYIYLINTRINTIYKENK